MAMLVLGLVLFLGIHSTRMVSQGWRDAMVATLGEKGWKGLYSVVSLAGFVLLVWGFGLARQAPVVLWAPPASMRHLAALLMALALVLLVAAFVPGNHFKARLQHPMLLSVKVWALAHLLANGSLADVLLFGSFLLWAVPCYRSMRRRDRAAGGVRPAGRAGPTLAATVLGLGLWAALAWGGHAWLFGVSPLGR